MKHPLNRFRLRLPVTALGRTRSAACLIALLALAAPALHAQTTPVPAARPADERAETLEARMAAFREAMGRGMQSRADEFFPRRGDFTWVHTTHFPFGDRVGVWRFRGTDAAEAMKLCGPLYHSFKFLVHGQPIGRLVHQMGWGGPTWRVGRRFLTQGELSKSPAFVEWRREDGRWVVSSFGDEGFRADPRRRRLGEPQSMVVRDTSAAQSRDDVYQPADPWRGSTLPITFEGYRYLRYGNPRPIASHELEWIARMGPVRVYAQPRARPAEVIYIPTAPGVYQPYMAERSPECG